MTAPVMDKPSFECVERVEDSSNAGDAPFEDEKHLSLWQAFKAYPRIEIFALAACSSGMMFGYDQIVNGASIALPSFILYYGKISAATHEPYLPSIWTSLWTAMSALMQAVGGIAIAPVSDKIGRRWSSIACCAISTGGVGIQYASTSGGMLLAGKMVNGFAIGAGLAVATAWASEISPVRLRGPVQSAIVLSTVFMQAMGLLVLRQNVASIEEKAFRLTFAIQWLFPGMTAILFFLVPESPTWLVLKNRLDSAKSSVRRLYGQDHEARYAHIKHQVEEEAEALQATGIGGYLELYRASNIKRTLTVHLMFFGIGLAGSSFLAQSTYFLVISGFPAIHTFDVAIGGFGLAIFTIILSWIYLERVGRRSLWLIGAVVNTIFMAIIGGLGFSHAKAALWAVGILMNVLVCIQNTTLTSVAWVIAGEISPYRLRSKNQSIAVLSNSFTTWLFNFTVPYMYNIDSGNLGAKTGFVFAGASVLLLLASYPLIPDLRGFSTVEIDWLYQNKVNVRKFQQHRDRAAIEVSESRTGKVESTV